MGPLGTIQKTNTMKKIKIEKTLLVAALTLGLAASASAQSTAAVSAAPATVPDSYNGLVGANYTELSFGYLKEEATPDLFRDYQFVYNEPVRASGGIGFDANFTYDYMTGGAWGYHDYRSEPLLGATAYLLEGGGKPFVTADVGWALQQSADRVENSYAYALTAGAEFQLARAACADPVPWSVPKGGAPAAPGQRFRWPISSRLCFQLRSKGDLSGEPRLERIGDHQSSTSIVQATSASGPGRELPLLGWRLIPPLPPAGPHNRAALQRSGTGSRLGAGRSGLPVAPMLCNIQAVGTSCSTG